MVNPLTYFQEVRHELARVTWPSQEKTINMTVLVVTVSLIMALFIAGTDFVFQQMIEYLIG